MKNIIFSILAVSCLSYCVSFSEYKKLESKLDSQKKENQILKERLSQDNKKLQRVYSQQALLIEDAKLNDESQSLIKKLKKSVNAKHLNLRVINGRLVLILPSDILFQSGSSSVSKIGSRTIEKIANIFISNPGYKYQIEGHTDNVPIHTPRFPSNWELASSRALNVLHTMVASGMDPQYLSSASFADTYPITSNETEQGRRENRRIEIALIPDFSAFDLIKKNKK